MKDAIQRGHISGDGFYTKQCSKFFQSRYHFTFPLLTTSCTHALEMAALLIEICPGDEIIVPSFTFVSTANAFALRGANIVFADSGQYNPNIGTDGLEALITPKTKAIVPVHYAGFGCDMSFINSLAAEYKIHVIEDAAQAIDSYYCGKPLGSFGALSTFSFHETKNIISGEGGMLSVNNPIYLERAEIIREKGTNRSKFFRGEVDKYTWVDLGSSYLPSDLIAAYLYAQLESMDAIQSKRLQLWNLYFSNLSDLEQQHGVQLPHVPDNTTCNAHMFYLVCRSLVERSDLIYFLSSYGIKAVFHYQALHTSQYFQPNHDSRDLAHASRYSDCLVRLPLYCDLTVENVNFISQCIWDFYRRRSS